MSSGSGVIQPPDQNVLLYGATNPALTGTITGIQNGDSIAPT